MPDAKFIYIVRDPIERIVAHWVQTRADGERMSLASALADYERPDHRLVCASRYATQIEKYLEYFSLPPLLILDREDLKSDRGRTMRQVFRFLEVDPDFHSSVFDSELNTRRDKRAMTGAGSVLWQRALVPAGRRLPAAIKVRGRAPLHRAFSRPVAIPPLDPEVESGLRELLRPEVDRAAPTDRKGLRHMVDMTPAAERARFREGFGFAVMSFITGALVGVGSSILVARLYGVDVVGQYALAIAPMGVVWFLSTVRERPALIRALTPLSPRAPRVTGLFAAVFAFSVALTVVVSILVAGDVRAFQGPIDQPELFVPSIVCLAGYVSSSTAAGTSTRSCRPSATAGSCSGSGCTSRLPSWCSRAARQLGKRFGA